MKPDLSNGGGIKMFLVDLIFPSRCPFCDKVIPYDRLCCERCFDECKWSDENICRYCGKSVLRGCLCDEVTYDECVCAAYYSGNARKAIRNLKYRHEGAGAVVFGRVLHDMLIERDLLKSIDIAVPVPMYKGKLRERGYNQAELIAREIVRNTDISIRNDLIYRDDPETEQHLLGAEERRKAAFSQYHAAKAELDGETILLIDDVLTTGSTFSACTDELRRIGAGKVICAAAVTAGE